MTSLPRPGASELRFVDIAAAARAAGRDIRSYPFVIRVLIENLQRQRAWGEDVSTDEIDALWDWPRHVNTGLPLRAARVILPDSSGVPVLQDLAALRGAVAARGGDAAQVDVRIPVDLVVDHSLQVDHFGSPMAMALNMRREIERNAERYTFLKWAQQAFRGLRVFPPGTGIIHQVNLETIAPVVARRRRADVDWAFPDFVIGGDSHTPMINALGVLGWGVGGIDAEAALLGEAYTFPVPAVVGVRLTGAIRSPAMTTDAALLVTRLLRQAQVSGCMVEFFGPAVAQMPVTERATMANMAPEYGATCGFFPVDAQTLSYLRQTGRDPAQVALVDAYCRANSLWRDGGQPEPSYSRIVEIDLSQASPGLAGPRRPQDLLPVAQVGADFVDRLRRTSAEGGFRAAPDTATKSHPGEITDGSVVLAAITSCTNTSNPAVMIAAGMVARRAVEVGLTRAAWVKTSLAPGSRVVTGYLERAGLLAPLAALGFDLIGYGCTTCGGKSGPLIPEVAARLEASDTVAVAVLSGNRNFEGRIHKLIRANYIGSPPLVVLYAIAGRIDIDFETEPVGNAPDGRPVFMHELWPDDEAIKALLPLSFDQHLWASVYDPAQMESQTWAELAAPQGAHFAWDPASSYLVEPPFFRSGTDAAGLDRLASALRSAKVLAAFGDSLTTDHISPGGEIPPDTPAGQYLQSLGVAPRDFNSYVSRRGNFEVMKRATFANIRVKNLLVPGTEGGITRHFPDGARMTVFDAAEAYAAEGQAVIVLGGKEYGTGSSRDWAARGSALLGVKAVIAESFERIHRANLVGMGILPLIFAPGEGWRQIGLNGDETFSVEGVGAGVLQGTRIVITAAGSGRVHRFEVTAELLTTAERQLLVVGGISASVLSNFAKLPGETSPDAATERAAALPELASSLIQTLRLE